MSNSLEKDINVLMSKYDRIDILNAISTQGSNESIKELTIVSNRGLHSPPEEFLFGEVYYATDGKISFSDVKEVNNFLDDCLSKLKDKLLSERWDRIYLVPFGHVVINIHIKITVFRTLWMDTLDVFYFGDNKYGLVDRDSRNSLID